MGKIVLAGLYPTKELIKGMIQRQLTGEEIKKIDTLQVGKLVKIENVGLFRHIGTIGTFSIGNLGDKI